MSEKEFDRALDIAILRDSKHDDDLTPYRPIWDGDQYIGGKPLQPADVPTKQNIE